MKKYKTLFFCVYAFLFFCLASASALLFRRAGFSSFWLPMIISFMLSGVSVWLCFVIKKAPEALKLTVISAVNSLALGFALCAWYVYKNNSDSALTLLAISAVAVGMLLLSRAVFAIPFIRRHYKVFMTLSVFLTIILFIIYAYFFREPYLMALGAYTAVQWFFAAVMNLEHESAKEIMTSARIASFGVILASLIILLTVLTEDDGPADAVLELFDAIPETAGKSLKKQR